MGSAEGSTGSMLSNTQIVTALSKGTKQEDQL